MYHYYPLENEKQLEYLVRDLLSVEYRNYSPFDLYGNRGQEQHGNDIIGYSKSGHMILAQVKKKNISRNKIKEELLNDLVNEIKSILNHFQKDKINNIFFVSTHGRDKDIQDKALELTQEHGVKIIYWGWDTIEEKVSFSQELQKKYFYKKTTTLLTTLPENSYCIGRKDEFSKIKILFEKENIINIQSIGGIGKSTFANSFIHEEKENYDFIGYISVEDNLEEAFFRSFNNFFNFSENDNVETIIYKLQSLAGRKILIIDNLIYQKDIIHIKKLSSSFKILITSRVLFNDVVTLKLGQLQDEVLKELFTKYNDQNIKEKYLIELFKYLDYHTLFIELTSKTINQNSFTIEYILNEFRDGNFPIIKVDRDLDTYQEVIYNDYLKKLFEESIEKLDYGLFYGLVLLSLFPSINLHVDEINRVFGGDLSDDLSLLSKKGWLISVDKEVFKVHQIIKEFFLFNYPMHAQDITPMIKYYLVNIEWNETDHPSEQKKYMIFVKSLIDSLKGYDEGIIILANNVAMLYRYFGFFEIALKYMLIVKDFDEKNNNDTNLSQTYNNIGNVYHKLGDIDNTIKYFELSMDIREKYNDPLLSESYLAMGSLLSENGYVDIAKKYLDILENMEINEKSFIPIFNLGILIYTKLKKPKLVMKYINAALSCINNKTVDENHLYIAYTYNNISLFYEKLFQDYNLAIHYKQKQDELMKKNFSEEHKDSKNIKTDLERLNKLNSL